MAGDHPDVVAYQSELQNTYVSLGILQMDSGDAVRAARSFEAALIIGKRLTASHPESDEFHNALAGNLVNLALLNRDAKDRSVAQAYLEEALPHHYAALKAYPKKAQYLRYYRNNRSLFLLLELPDHAQTARAATELAKLDIAEPGDTYDAACAFSRCVPLAEKDEKLGPDKRKELTRQYAETAVTLLQAAVKKGWKNVAHMKKDSDLDPVRNRDDFTKLLAELEAEK
jgi:hypothetical protein